MRYRKAADQVWNHNGARVSIYCDGGAVPESTTGETRHDRHWIKCFVKSNLTPENTGSMIPDFGADGSCWLPTTPPGWTTTGVQDAAGKDRTMVRDRTGGDANRVYDGRGSHQLNLLLNDPYAEMHTTWRLKCDRCGLTRRVRRDDLYRALGSLAAVGKDVTDLQAFLWLVDKLR